jgi:hypothetical protein
MLNNKGFSNILVISIFLVLLGVGGYFGYMYTKKSPAPIKNEPTMTTQPQPVTKKSLPTDQELIDSIRKDLSLDMNEEINIQYKDRANPTLENRLYVTTEKYEVVSAGYKYAGHIYARPVSGGKWKDEYSAQNSFECKELDRLGLTKAQTIEWQCFDYDKQVYRK